MSRIAKASVFFIFLFLTINSASLVQAFEVTDYGVTIDREKNGGQILHCFCTDLWGTDIASAAVTSPANANPPNTSYVMSYIVDEGQWAYDEAGPPSTIDAKFPDGTYRFDVIYTDNSNETFFVTLNRAFPPFPEITSFGVDHLGWDPWDGSPNGFVIEVGIESEGGNEHSCELPTTATRCDLPEGFVDGNSVYSIDMLFLSSNSPHAFTNSGLLQTCNSTDTDSDGILDDGDCSSSVEDNPCAGGTTEGCDDNCPDFPNPDQGPALFGHTVLLPNSSEVVWGIFVNVTIARGAFTASTDIGNYVTNATVSDYSDRLLDGTLPPPGSGLWYMARPTCAVGSWSSGGPGEVPGRDANLP